MDFSKWARETADRIAKQQAVKKPPDHYFVVRAGVKKEVTLEEYNLALKEKDRENDPRSIASKNLVIPKVPGATLDLRTMFDDDMTDIIATIKATPLPEGVTFDEATMTLRYDGKGAASHDMNGRPLVEAVGKAVASQIDKDLMAGEPSLEDAYRMLAGGYILKTWFDTDGTVHRKMVPSSEAFPEPVDYGQMLLEDPTVFLKEELEQAKETIEDLNESIKERDEFIDDHGLHDAWWQCEAGNYTKENK